MLPVSGNYSMGFIPSGSEFLLYLFSFIRAIKYLSWNLLGSADLGDEFADGGTANQSVVPQGGVGLSSGQMSQDYGKFESIFKWLPEIGDSLAAVVNAFLDEFKKAGGILTKFWYIGMSVCMRICIIPFLVSDVSRA